MKDYIFGTPMRPATNAANNKTTLLTAATERSTLSFCIVLHLLDVVDSVFLEDLRLGCVSDAA